MAESSILWTTGGAGDGAAAYTAEQWFEFLRNSFIPQSVTTEGVSYFVGNKLLVTGAVSPMQVDTGYAVVYGIPYFNTAAVNVVVATPPALRGYRIVLRAGWTARTVRITLITGVSDVIPAMTQTPGVTYDIPLASFQMTAGGAVQNLTDNRTFIHCDTRVNTAMLENLSVVTAIINDLAVTTGKLNDLAVTTGKLNDLAVTTAKIADLNVTTGKLALNSVDDTIAGNRVPQFYRRQGGDANDWSVVGANNYTPTAVRMQAGAQLEVAGAAHFGDIPITFPVAFSNPPLIVATAQSDDHNVAADTITANGFLLKYKSISDSAVGTIVANWFAVGPE